ncbi:MULTISPECIES: morphogenic membrane protein MmpB [unclassified Streptomyces]
MLWSDPENQPPQELREAQHMMRRAGVLIALATVAIVIILGLR